MRPDQRTVRLLGAAFLLVFVSILLTKAAGSGGTADVLRNVAGNLGLVRASVLAGLVTSIGIVVLGSLLYVVLKSQGTAMALVALGLYLAEAVALAMSKVGLLALMSLSLEYVRAGASEATRLLPLGELLYRGLWQQADTIHNLFFCVGAVLWYYLFFRSRFIPRALALWGMISVCLVLANVLWALLDPDIGTIILMGAPYIVWEALIGPWLLIKGVKVPPLDARATPSAGPGR
jgi:hypothetical protein